jgi:hypothetical protein
MENRCLDNRTLEGALRTLILYTGHFGGGNVSTYRWETWNPGVGEALLESKVIRPSPWAAVAV